MSEDHNAGVEHVVTVESRQVWKGSVPAEMSEFLTWEGERRNIYGTRFEGIGTALEFHEELTRTFECSCGQRFRKPETAREHLEEVADGE